MSKKSNKNTKVLMIPEGETRDNASFHFVHSKTVKQLREAKKLRFKKYHPGKREHVMFVETRMPSHNK